MPPLTEQEVRKIIRDEFKALIKSDRYVIEKTIQMADGRNFQFARGTGTKHGTDVDQKQSFYGVTPIVQPSGANQAVVTGTADATYSANEVTLINALVTLSNEIRSVLVNLGLMKGSA